MNVKVKPLEWVKKSDVLFEGKPPKGLLSAKSVFRVYKTYGVWKVIEPMCEYNFGEFDTPEEALVAVTKYYKERVLNAIEVFD